MTSPRRVPIFDGHNDVLLRLHQRSGRKIRVTAFIPDAAENAMTTSAVEGVAAASRSKFRFAHLKTHQSLIVGRFLAGIGYYIHRSRKRRYLH